MLKGNRKLDRTAKGKLQRKLPSWLFAEVTKEFVIEVNVPEAFPYFLDKLRELDVEVHVDQYWYAVFRRTYAKLIREFIGEPVQVALVNGRDQFGGMSEGEGRDKGADAFVPYYRKFKEYHLMRKIS